MLSVIYDVTACSDSHNMQLGLKLSSVLRRYRACELRHTTAQQAVWSQY